jgi:hypothetical protein
MNFERGIDPKAALGIGEFGKRGLSYEDPYIKGSRTQFHIKYLVWILDGWYKYSDEKISIFHFPCNQGFSDDRPPFVITALPGEPTDYYSMYRKISYSEIISKFWTLVNESWDFRLLIVNRSLDLANFLKIEIF